MSALPEMERNSTVIEKLWDFFKGPFFWGAVGVLAGVIISPVTFKYLFIFAWLVLAIGVGGARFFQRRGSWGVSAAGNFALFVALAFGLVGLYKIVPKPKEPPSLDDTLNAFGQRFPGLLSAKDASQPRDVQNNSKKTQPKPQAPKFAQLEFSFYVSEAEKFPKLFQSISVPSDRSFDLEFFAKNISNDVAAERGDIFMAVCLECRYMKEPTGFQKLSESPESTRHKTFDIINPGLSLEPWTVSILPPSLPFAFDVSFQYECKTCGPKHAVQVLKVDVLRGEN